MSDSYREVTSTSWFGRLGRSVGGTLVGLLLVIAMIILLFWNEGRAVITAKSLAEGAGAVVSVAADTVDPANDQKLVHVEGRLTTSERLGDPAFGISAKGIRLVRSAEMYQWKQEAHSETDTKLGGGQETTTTYTYSRGWSDQPIDSTDFKQPNGHGNPPMELRGRRAEVATAELGAFRLDEPVIQRIGGDADYPVPADTVAAVRAAFQGDQKVTIVDGGVYLGRNPLSPSIGDYRISYTLAPAGDMSVVARQAGSGFQPYQTAAGRALLMVDTGMVSAEQMFADAVSGNTAVTWIVRAVGLIVMAIGFAMMLGILGVIADVIPFLGGIVRLGTGVLAFVMALLVGTVTIAVAWFWYRPLLSVALVAVALAVAFLLSRLGAKRPAATATSSAPQAG